MLVSLLFIAEYADFQNQNKLSRELKSVRTGKQKRDSEKNQNKQQMSYQCERMLCGFNILIFLRILFIFVHYFLGNTMRTTNLMKKSASCFFYIAMFMFMFISFFQQNLWEISAVVDLGYMVTWSFVEKIMFDFYHWVYY